MQALRRNIAAKEVKKEDFKAALNKIGPSLTPDMEKFYESFAQSFKRMEKALIPPPIA